MLNDLDTLPDDFNKCIEFAAGALNANLLHRASDLLTRAKELDPVKYGRFKALVELP